MREWLIRSARVGRGLALVGFVVGTGVVAAILAIKVPSTVAGPASASASPVAPEKVKRFGRDGVSIPSDMSRNLGLQTDVVSDRVRPMQLPPQRLHLVGRLSPTLRSTC